MTHSLKMTVGAGLTAALLVGCPADDSSGSGGTTSADTTGGQVSVSATGTPTPAPTIPTMTGGDSVGSTSAADTGSDTAGSATDTGSDTGTTGAKVDCVDEDIGSVVGMDVVTGTNDGQGDDFDASECIGDGPVDSAGEVDVGGGGGGGGVLSGDDYVIAWSAPKDGRYTIIASGKFDTVLMIREPSCGGEMIECNDDCIDTNSGQIIEASAGQMFFFVIDGYDGGTGDFSLDIRAGDMLMCDGGGMEEGPGVDSGGPMTTVGD